MDVGSILIGIVIDFIFLKDFIESVIKKKYLQMAVCGIFLLSTTVEYFRIVFSDCIKVINVFINSRVAFL